MIDRGLTETFRHFVKRCRLRWSHSWRGRSFRAGSDNGRPFEPYLGIESPLAGFRRYGVSLLVFVALLAAGLLLASVPMSAMPQPEVPQAALVAQPSARASTVTGTVGISPGISLPLALSRPLLQLRPLFVPLATETLAPQSPLVTPGAVEPTVQVAGFPTATIPATTPATSSVAGEALLLPTPTPTPIRPDRTEGEATAAKPGLDIGTLLDLPLPFGGAPSNAAGTNDVVVVSDTQPMASPTVTAAPDVVIPAAPVPTATVAPTPDGATRVARVPILMYHYLSVPPANADIYRQDLSVAPALFAEHLDTIRAAGYTTISLYDLLAHLTQANPLPEKPVILTFDDGYRDNYENAFPALRDRGMTATFFLVTDFIDAQLPEYVTWDMVRAMSAAGMSIESHGRNHASLKARDDDFLVWQALGSLETIEYEIGVRPRFVSYPAGEYDQRTIDIFRSAHYWAGLTTTQGATHTSTDDLFQLRRVRIRGTTTPDELLRLLSLDW